MAPLKASAAEITTARVRAALDAVTPRQGWLPQPSTDEVDGARDRGRDGARGRAAAEPTEPMVPTVPTTEALSWGQLLREGAADRVPLPLRNRSTTVRAAVAALGLAVAMGAGLLAHAAWQAEPAPTRVVAAAPPSPSAPGAGASTPAREVIVDVAGLVRRPGLVRLPSGSRVADALAAAGGAQSGADLQRINLARLLVDGEQVLVQQPGDPGIPTARASPAEGPIVDLNTASEADLDALPGVGPVLAARITAWRAAHGRFARVEELAEVDGIGDRLLAALRPLVRV